MDTIFNSNYFIISIDNLYTYKIYTIKNEK